MVVGLPKYDSSVRKDVEKAMKGKIAEIDFKKSIEYHSQHIGFEIESLNMIPAKAASLLNQHIQGHLLVLKMKGAEY